MSEPVHPGETFGFLGPNGAGKSTTIKILAPSRTSLRGPRGWRVWTPSSALAMSVLFTAMFSAASIVRNREFGFLREMLVAR